ncbi:MAG TPA: twin-arginine translocase TatA/TatE family subunit [Candidatus Bathyarchaeia archaeon]|nr:twin-arginine translocase TatA/TatE family subunit [Candidatus Bathyarchaeia archaeon]
MAIIGTEWLILAAIILIVFLFRPRAVTDLARSVGQVVAEFRKGKQESEKTPKQELLVETAERLGIKTEGKTPTQIREEILAKAGRDDR